MLKFIKDFIIYGFSSILGKFVAIFLMPIYTSILTREEYGAMAMLISVKGIIDLVSNLNIHSGIARDYYEENINRVKLISTGMWSIALLSSTIMILMLTTRSFWLDSVLGLSSYSSSFVLLLLSIPTGSLMSYFAILTRFKKKSILFSIGSILGLCIQLSVSIYTIVILKIGIIGFFLATFVSESISIIYYAIINREYIALKFENLYLKRALLFSLPLLPAILAGWLDTSFGQLIVGKYISFRDLGVYSVALQVASGFTLISVALNNVWSPFLYENYSKENFQQNVNRIYTLFIFILCAVSSAISLLSREIILLLSNLDYLDATLYLTLLCIPMSIYLLYPLASSGISISRDTKYTSISYLIGCILNIFFLLLFISKIGVLSVPIGLAISRIVTYLFMCNVTHKKGLLKLPNIQLGILLGIVLICYAVVYFGLSLIYRLVLLLMIESLLFYWINKNIPIVNYMKKIIR